MMTHVVQNFETRQKLQGFVKLWNQIKLIILEIWVKAIIMKPSVCMHCKVEKKNSESQTNEVQ